jgi:hypothetical protein
MTEPPIGPDSDRPSTPRWARVFGIVITILLLLFAALWFTGGPAGGHGPGRHFS